MNALRSKAVRVLGALMLAGALTACAGPGRVVDRRRCKTSECIYVQQDADRKVRFEMASLGAWPDCVKGARWPDCQGGEQP